MTKQKRPTFGLDLSTMRTICPHCRKVVSPVEGDTPVECDTLYCNGTSRLVPYAKLHEEGLTPSSWEPQVGRCGVAFVATRFRTGTDHLSRTVPVRNRDRFRTGTDLLKKTIRLRRMDKEAIKDGLCDVA